jgi:hypothetical protein
MKSRISHDNESLEKSPKKFSVHEETLSIHERLYMNFTETCPLFLLKEGIDHRFEFLDFAPDLYLRQTFNPINSDEFISNNPETQIEQIHLFSKNIPENLNQTTEIE